jgi:hypothetical protein
MTSQAVVALLYVQDSEPGFMWVNGCVIAATEADRRQRIFGVLGLTARKARVDRQTPAGRVVWGRAALVIEAPLHGRDRSGRPLSLTMAVLGNPRAADWHDGVVELADAELTRHGLETDRAVLEAILREAQRLRPGLLLAWWLDLRHLLMRTWRLAASRLSVQLTTQDPQSRTSGEETTDERS